MIFGATLCLLAIFQLTKEDLFWQPYVGHSCHMASTSELGEDAGNIDLADDFGVGDSVLPLDPQRFPQTAQEEKDQFPGIALEDSLCFTPIQKS